MLLAIDIGNSTVVGGLFQGQTLRTHWSIATDVRKSDDEYGLLFRQLVASSGVTSEPISCAILSSVVPSLTDTLAAMVQRYFHCSAMIVTSETDSGLILKYKNPREIGSDRIVNAAAAYDRYRTDLIIVDFGTATTFCAVTKAGEYLGGAIAPGLGISAEALFARTAQLPKVAFVRPKSVIGIDTASGIQSGLFFGYVGLVNEIVRRMGQELGRSCYVLATGGLSTVIAPETDCIQETRPLLTLEGLEFLHRRAQIS